MRTTFYIKFCVCLLCLSVSLGLSAKDSTRVSPKQMTNLVIPEDSVHKASRSMEKAARERNSTERISMPETITEKTATRETSTEEISTQEAAPEEVASQEVSTEKIATEENLPEEKESFVPDSNKALWYAALCPGLGQIYNRRYWKLPIVASGIVGVSYAISWNGKYYEAYTYAYRDLIDGDPNTNYFRELIPPGANYSESQMQTLFKNRQQTFRRQRDLSIIVGVGFYLICLLDAYVDAELFNFDISDNLSFHWGSESEEIPQWREPQWRFVEEPQNLNLSFSLHF